MEDMHWWDWTTPIEEVMQGLNNLVKAGKGASFFGHYLRVIS
jgi:aryl-alcohol dehydrogenase-like predicted oxidoreductase